MAERLAAQNGRGWMLRWGWFALAAPIGVALGRAAGSGTAVAALPVLLMFPAYWNGLGRRQALAVFGQSLLWAAALSASLIVWTVCDPASAGAVIWKGLPYREEMFQWIRTGRGAEGDPRLFLPLHAAHLGGFVAASLVSGGLLGLLMGSVLMGYMSFYVGSVVLASSRPWLAALVAWHPWSVLRVAGFVACGVALSMPLRHRRLGAADKRLLAAGLALVVLDAILKTVLAEPWRRIPAFSDVSPGGKSRWH